MSVYLQIYWFGISWPTRNVKWKASSFCLKRWSNVWPLPTGQLHWSMMFTGDFQCYEYKFSHFIVPKSNRYLQDVHYFWHMFKLLMFWPFKIFKRIFPNFILYCVLGEHSQCDSVVYSSQVSWTNVVYNYLKCFLIFNHLVLMFYCDFLSIHMCFFFCPLLVNGHIHLLDYSVEFVKCQFLNFMILSFIHLHNDCEK